MLKTLFSIQFGIILLVAILIASFIGIFVDTLLSTETAYNYVYCSYWFAFLLVLLFINIIGCSYKSTINKFRSLKRKPFKSSSNEFKNAELWAETDFNERNDIKKLDRIVRKYFRYRVWNKDSLYARKGIVSKFGGVITHLGILLIIIGALYSVFGVKFGFSSLKSQLFIAEGDEKESYIDWSKTDEEGKPLSKKFGFKIRLIDFDFDKFPGTEIPKAYTSVAEFIEDGKKTRDVINMTKTASYRNFKFNQMHYYSLSSSVNSDEIGLLYWLEGDELLQNIIQKRLLISFVDENGSLKKFDVLVGVKDLIPDSDYSILIDKDFVGHIYRNEKEVYKQNLSGSFKIKIERFFPNFTVKNGEGTNVDDTFENPAIKYTVLLNDKELYSDYAFNKEEFRNFSTVDGIFDVEFIAYLFENNTNKNLDKAKITLNMKNKLNGEDLEGVVLNVGVEKPIYADAPQSDEDATTDKKRFDLKITGFEDTYYSVLGVSKSSFLFNFYWYLSFCFVIIGPCLAFFIKYRQLWIYFDREHSKIYLSEKSKGDTDLRRHLIQKIVEEIKK